MLNRSLFNALLATGLLAGTLDILAAMANYAISTGKDPSNVLRFVASGAFGTDAFSGGAPMAAWGLFFHYIVAFSWTILFFWLYPKVDFLSQNRIVTGLAYGIVIWLVMTFLVLPLTRVPQSPFHPVQATKGAIILMLMVGLPIAWMAGRYYQTARQ